MDGTMRRALSGAALVGVMLVAQSSSALLLEKGAIDDTIEYSYFYPYVTSYEQVDEKYAFDDDPLKAFVREPYKMTIEVKRVTVRRSMVRPRTQFVDEMYDSADRL